MGTLNRTYPSLWLSLVIGACDASDGSEARMLDPPQFNHVGKLGLGSAVYLGRGIVLTNWHLCSKRDTSLSYNDPGELGARYREGTPLDKWQCKGSDAVHESFPENETDCSLGFTTLRVGLEFGEDRADVAPNYGFTLQTVFAQRAIDLCIMHMPEPRRPTTLSPDDLLLIDTKPVSVGQEVVLGGYPKRSKNVVIERCRVVRATELVRDPDLLEPSELVVPSFAIDCKTGAHGSSGSPVLDAHTGLLLGLMWTGECTLDGKCGTALISAASEWRRSQGNRPASEYSVLESVLGEFEAP